MAEQAASKKKRGLYREYLLTVNPISSMPRRTRYRYEQAIKAAQRDCGLQRNVPSTTHTFQDDVILAANNNEDASADITLGLEDHLPSEESLSDDPKELPSTYEELSFDYSGESPSEGIPSEYPEGSPSEELLSEYLDGLYDNPEGLPSEEVLSDYIEELPSDYPEGLPSEDLSDCPNDTDNREDQSPHHHSEEQQFQEARETLNINQDVDDVPLYPGASITVNVTMVLILAFSVRHKLTNEALSDLLYLIDKICPQPNNGCKTLYNFRKYFSCLLTPVKFCYYCVNCFGLVNDLADNACIACGKVFTIKDLSYFLHFSVSDQIKSLFIRKDFFNNIQYRFLRTKLHESNYEDIFDGLLYQQHMASNGILASKCNISLTWNVDGLPLFKSSKFSLWPMYFIINELPYKLRVLKENVIISGLWFGEIKPNMTLFLKPIITELLTLEQHGVEVKPPTCNSPFISKVIVLAGTCDLPAKCLMLNSIQFNGEYGCSKCLEPGITFTTSAHGHTHVYPYKSEYPTGHGPKRSKDTYHDDAIKALEDGLVVHGVKGPSWLMKLAHYDIIRGTTIDYMHCALLGVTKLLMSLWFGKGHNHERYYIGRKIDLVDKRLSEINTPSIITRRPRKLSEHFKYYKASEYRSFLLYYSLPALFDILPQDYWNHYALFVTSMHNLLQQSISNDQLLYCEQTIKLFCRQFEGLYGRRYMTANIHLLLHLTECVRELGPLWVYSCFHFESQNGILKSLVHGTQHVEKQIMSSFSYQKNLPAIAKELIPETNIYFEVFEHLYHSYHCHIPKQNCIKINDNVYLLGKPDNSSLSEIEMSVMHACTYSSVMSDYRIYSRALVNNIAINSCTWDNKKQRNSTIAYYNNYHSKLEYGLVRKIVLLNNNIIILLIVQLKPHGCPLIVNGQRIPHIETCIPPLDVDLAAIELNDICSPCIYMSFTDTSDKVYVSVLANVLEKD